MTAQGSGGGRRKPAEQQALLTSTAADSLQTAPEWGTCGCLRRHCIYTQLTSLTLVK